MQCVGKLQHCRLRGSIGDQARRTLPPAAGTTLSELTALRNETRADLMRSVQLKALSVQ